MPTPAAWSADQEGSGGWLGDRETSGQQLLLWPRLKLLMAFKGAALSLVWQTRRLDFSFNLRRREAFPEPGPAVGRDNGLERPFVYGY